MDTKKLSAEPRELIGRKTKQLRRQGILPSNIFGKGIKSRAVSVDIAEFSKVYQEVGETSLLNLEIKDKGKVVKDAVLVSNVQLDPVSGQPIHVDFHKVDLKEKVSADVPVELVGESPAEKQGLGTVVQYLNEVEVEALPMDLPEKFEVDMSKLEEVDQSIFVKDLPVDKNKIEILVDLEEIVVKVEPPQKEEEVAPPKEETEGLAEGGGEEKPEGEKAGAEGQTGEGETEQKENKEEGKE